jgi:hypothetical protein
VIQKHAGIADDGRPGSNITLIRFGMAFTRQASIFGGFGQGVADRDRFVSVS